MNMLYTWDLIGEIVPLPQKACFFLADAQRKYFVVNEQDIEELSICKIIIIDTGLFHIKRESFVTIEAELVWIIQESKLMWISILYLLAVWLICRLCL